MAYSTRYLILTTFVLVGCGPSPAASNGAEGGSASTGSSSSGSGNAMGGNGAASGSGFDCKGDATPADTVAVPAGDFIMGCNAAVDAACADDEKPMHTVTLRAFRIDKTEVTQAQYAACVADGACNAPSCAWDCSKGDYPASCVVFDDAKAYCAWAGARLPSEAEWEKAARGSDGKAFPWGNSAPDCTLANLAGCSGHAQAVGSLPAGKSPYGALDMAGNVVELVADWYDAAYYATSPASDPTGPASGTRVGGRGGGFKSEATWQRASKRDWYDLTDSGAALGFRCAL